MRVVTAAGGNRAWVARTGDGSGYVSPDKDCVFNSLSDLTNAEYLNLVGDWGNNTGDDFCAVPKGQTDWEKYTQINYKYQTDAAPFGAIVAPDDSQSPSDWDSKAAAGRQPLLYEPALPETSQQRMGQLHSEANLQKLFLQTYGVWEWDETESKYKYKDNNSAGGWDILTDWEGLSTRGYCPGDRGLDEVCRVRPLVSNIKVDGHDGITISRNKTVKLSFNVKVDPEQIPLKSYVIDWGDGEITSISGATLRGRENTDNPFVFYHP